MEENMTVETIIDGRVKLNLAAFAAVKAFRRSKAWRGTFEERLAKFNTLAAALADSYGLDPAPSIQFHGPENTSQMGDGAFDPRENKIHLLGKLSVVTFLHCFARARGKTRMEAFKWSLSVFKKMFPVSFSRCHSVGLFLIR